MRKGLNLHIVGETTKSCEYNGIVVRYASVNEWAEINNPTAHAVAADCDFYSTVIVFKPGLVIYQSLINHELLHAIGCWYHLFSTENTLYWSAVGPYSITHADTLCHVTEDLWPMGGPDPCFAELTMDRTLYVPAISGVMAKLVYAGVEGGYQVWALAGTSPVSASCAGFAVVDNIATLPRVLASPDKAYSAKLERLASGKLRLLEATKL